MSGIIALNVSCNSPLKKSLAVIAITIEIKNRIGNNQYRLLIFRTKGNESRILIQAFLEFVRTAANPIVKKKKIQVDFFNALYVF